VESGWLDEVNFVGDFFELGFGGHVLAGGLVLGGEFGGGDEGLLGAAVDGDGFAFREAGECVNNAEVELRFIGDCLGEGGWVEIEEEFVKLIGGDGAAGVLDWGSGLFFEHSQGVIVVGPESIFAVESSEVILEPAVVPGAHGIFGEVFAVVAQGGDDLFEGEAIVQEAVDLLPDFPGLLGDIAIPAVPVGRDFIGPGLEGRGGGRAGLWYRAWVWGFCGLIHGGYN
jgi:hypothetical protein